MISPHTKYSILVGVVTLVVLYTYGRIDYQNPDYSTWELHDYRAMAQASPGFTEGVRQPFVYRILGPYLCGMLPMSANDSFLFLSASAALTLSLLFYFYLCYTTIKPSIAALTTILFVLNKYLFGFPVWNYFHLDDILSQIEIVILLWMMLLRKWRWFGVVLLLGSLTRETPLIMIPVAFVFAFDRKILNESWKQILFASLPAIVSAILLRLLLHSNQGNNLFQALNDYSGKLILPETWFRLLINSFIPFSLVPLLFFQSTKKFVQSNRFAVVFFLLVLISTFFGYNNERLMAPAFIVFYLLLATIIQDHLAQSKGMILMIVVAALVSNLHHTYARYPFPREFTIALSISAFAVVTIVLFIYSRRSRATVRLRPHL